MTIQTFQDLRFQFENQWQAINQASGAERRVLVSELAMLLANWETSQTDTLDKMQTLTRIGHWKAIATTGATECDRIIGQLESNKAALRDKLAILKEQIDDGAQHYANILNELKELSAKTEAGDTQLEKLLQLQENTKAQLLALNAIAELKADMESAKTALESYEEHIRQGRDPTGAAETIGRLLALKEQLLAYYQHYAQSNEAIQQNLSILAKEDSVHREAKARLAQLEKIGSELKEIDRSLAQQLAALDSSDLTIGSRL